MAGQSESTTWAYDVLGNRTSQARTQNSTTDTTTYAYNGDNELTQTVDSQSGTTTFAYDANGSQASFTNGSNVTAYTYDARNRLASITANGAVQATYGYDDDGNRASQTSGGVTTFYLIDKNNPTSYPKPIEQKSSPTGTPTLSYVMGLNVIGQADGSGAVTYLLIDDQHNTRALVNSSGVVMASLDYDASGNVLGVTYTAANPPPTIFLFQQMMLDPASGLNLTPSREVRIGTLNFMQRDTGGHGANDNPITLNSYLLDNANVPNGWDPSGHDDLGGGFGLGGNTSTDAFGLAFSVATEDVAGFIAVNDYVSGNFGRIGAYANANFAWDDFYQNSVAPDFLAVTSLFGMLGGTVAGEAIGAIGDLLNQGLSALTMADEEGGQAVGALEEISQRDSAVAAECGEGGSCFLAGTNVLLGNGKTKEQIQDIHVGQRVATDGGVANSANGKTKAADPNATEIDPKTWRLITIDSGDWEIQTLEPLGWLEGNHLTVGRTIAMSSVVNLQEMGGAPAGMSGTIESITTCPTISSGPGRVVLATVTHLSNYVFDLKLRNSQGKSETIGVTGYHLIYTLDRGWVEASQLRMGEGVEGAYGSLTVTELIQDPGVFRGYNMDVEADHVYYVGELPALVHNVCGETNPEWEPNWDSREEALDDLAGQRDNIRIWNELGNGEAASSAARTYEYMEAYFEQLFGEPPNLPPPPS